MITGTAKRSAKRVTAAQAASDQRLPPSSMIGRSAAQSIFCSCDMSVRPGHVSTESAASASPTETRSISMSSGSAITTGPGSAVHRDMKRARHDFRNARRIVDLSGPFGDRAEHRAVVEFLEGLALAHLARDLADEHDDRGGVLPRDVQAGRAVGGAGAARHERDAGTAGELAGGLGHHHRPALLAADRDGDVAVMERVERGQIALAGHAEDMADAVDQQLVDQHLAARAHIVLAAHFPLLVTAGTVVHFAGGRNRREAWRPIGLPWHCDRVNCRQAQLPETC